MEVGHVQPTLRNLLGVLNTKLELCARLPVYEWEAQHAGHEGCARAFGLWAEAEHRSTAEVLDCLRDVLSRPVPVAEASVERVGLLMAGVEEKAA